MLQELKFCTFCSVDSCVGGVVEGRFRALLDEMVLELLSRWSLTSLGIIGEIHQRYNVLVSPGLLHELLDALEKEPEDRHQTAAELEAALQSVPLEDPWSQVKANEWWNLHGLAVEVAVADEPLDDEKGLSNRGISQFIYEP